MAKQVVLTDIAENDLEQITDYLLENWGINVCDRFLSRFEEVCATISNDPEIYPLTYKKERIRKCILSRQNIMYYRVRSQQIEIITIFDTRQNPDKLSKLIGDKN